MGGLCTLDFVPSTSWLNLYDGCRLAKWTMPHLQDFFREPQDSSSSPAPEGVRGSSMTNTYYRMPWRCATSSPPLKHTHRPVVQFFWQSGYWVRVPHPAWVTAHCPGPTQSKDTYSHSDCLLWHLSRLQRGVRVLRMFFSLIPHHQSTCSPPYLTMCTFDLRIFSDLGNLILW